MAQEKSILVHLGLFGDNAALKNLITKKTESAITRTNEEFVTQLQSLQNNVPEMKKPVQYTPGMFGEPAAAPNTSAPKGNVVPFARKP